MEGKHTDCEPWSRTKPQTQSGLTASFIGKLFYLLPRAERYVHAIFVTDSMCTFEKVRLGMHYADWKSAITASQLENFVWISSPSHAGVLGNERADVRISWDPGHPNHGSSCCSCCCGRFCISLTSWRKRKWLWWSTRYTPWASQKTFASCRWRQSASTP